MTTGPRPPEAAKVTCIAKQRHSAYFKGQEVSPDEAPLSLHLVGNVEYFEEGKDYALVFTPLP